MVFEKVRGLLARQLEIEEEKISLDTDIIDDLGADSLDVVELMMSLEEEFGFVVTDESSNNVRTVDDVVQFIEKMLDKM